MGNVWRILRSGWRGLVSLGLLIGILYIPSDIAGLPEALGIPRTTFAGWRVSIERETLLTWFACALVLWIIWMDARPFLWPRILRLFGKKVSLGVQRVPISAIRDHALRMGWKLDDGSSASSNDSFELAKRLRQSVIDGEQPLWGRLRIMPGIGHSPLTHETLPEHLKTHQIHPYSFRLDLPQEQTCTCTVGLMECKVGVTFDDLHVDLAKATAWLDRNRKKPDAQVTQRRA